MSYSKFEFTQISRLEVEALGKPGQRTFRIITESNNSVASIWIEKEHLLELSLSIKQLIDSTVEGEDAAASGMVPNQLEAPDMTKLDFKVSRLGLKHDEPSGMFLIEFNDTDNIENTNNTSDLTLWVNRYQVDLFADQAIKICASGRPLCNLCGVPVDSPEEGGHLCPRRNGNHPIDEIQKI
ncbi:MAG: hypothetical protein DK302_000187 [Chloroflexi bacterium]|jgi:uncharacterized repeat protein (TIGR03847 family)|nr:MAG: hypothetical protein DK302_000187 [Chloroflexota bacterium]